MTRTDDRLRGLARAQRDAPRELLDLEGNAVIVVDAQALDDAVGRTVLERRTVGDEAAEAHQRVVGEEEPPLRVLDDDAVRELAQHRLEPLGDHLRVLQRACVIDDHRQATPDLLRDQAFVRRERPRARPRDGQDAEDRPLPHPQGNAETPAVVLVVVRRGPEDALPEPRGHRGVGVRVRDAPRRGGAVVEVDGARVTELRHELPRGDLERCPPIHGGAQDDADACQESERALGGDAHAENVRLSVEAGDCRPEQES